METSFGLVYEATPGINTCSKDPTLYSGPMLGAYPVSQVRIVSACSN